MGKLITETNYKRFTAVGQDQACRDCPSSCKTSCARVLEKKHEINPKEDFKDSKVHSHAGIK